MRLVRAGTSPPVSSLERYRVQLDPNDLSAARDALTAVRQAVLSPRDRVDLLGRLVTEGLIPEREREAPDAAAELRMQWQALKEQWR